MKLKVLSLKPTQMAIGYYEVDKKIEMLKKMKEHEIEEYLKEKQVPVILGPNNEYYMIDRHHLVRSAWESNIDEVHVELKADFSHLSYGDFWQAMKHAKWVLLQDQFGTEHDDYNLLPLSIRQMADDPYRSIAWILRETKIYSKSKQPYAEFLWANQLRIFNEIQIVEKNYDGIEKAAKIAIEIIKKTPSKFKHLPGFKS